MDLIHSHFRTLYQPSTGLMGNGSGVRITGGDLLIKQARLGVLGTAGTDKDPGEEWSDGIPNR